MPIKGKPSYYEWFGLENYEPDQKKIKAAFRAMALKWHPDRCKDKVEAEGKMKQVNEVYETLKGNKAKYDLHLKRNFDGHKFDNSNFHFNDSYTYGNAHTSSTAGQKSKFKEPYSETWFDDLNVATSSTWEDLIRKNTQRASDEVFNDLNEIIKKREKEAEEKRKQKEHKLEEQWERRKFFEDLTDGEYVLCKSIVEKLRQQHGKGAL